MAYRVPWGQGVAYRVPGGQGVGYRVPGGQGIEGCKGPRGRPRGPRRSRGRLQGPRWSRGRPRGLQGAKRRACIAKYGSNMVKWGTGNRDRFPQSYILIQQFNRQMGLVENKMQL